MMMKSRPDRFARAAHDLDRQAHAVLAVAAPGVVALVGARGEELVDEVAFRAHDLDAVVARLRASSAQRTKSPIVRSTPRAVSARGVNGVIGDLIADGATENG